VRVGVTLGHDSSLSSKLAFHASSCGCWYQMDQKEVASAGFVAGFVAGVW